MSRVRTDRLGSADCRLPSWLMQLLSLAEKSRKTRSYSAVLFHDRKEESDFHVKYRRPDGSFKNIDYLFNCEI